jgi:hypothetical protein
LSNPEREEAMNTCRAAVHATLIVATAALVACDQTPAAPVDGAEGPVGDALQQSDLFAEARRPTEEFGDLEIFLEFNSTDNDLGVQVFLDGDAWDRVVARDPTGHTVLDFVARHRLGALGLTEMRFESAEPSPAEVLRLIRPGEYVFRGRTVDGGRLLGEAELSHDLPPAPVITAPTGTGVDPDDTVVRWNAVAGVEGYEVIVENVETEATLEVSLGADATSLHVPTEFMEGGTEYKVEVLAVAENGNKTITERDFETAP